MVFTINPGLVRTAMSESALSCGEPSIERWFAGAFANQEDLSTESAATLVIYLASGAADVLSGRTISAAEDVAQMVARADEIEKHDLYVLREPEQRITHPPAPAPAGTGSAARAPAQRRCKSVPAGCQG